METKFTKEEKYLRAKKRVEELKGFYIHFGVYILVNLFISCAQIVDGVTEDKSFIEIFSDFGMYAVWLIWGVGLFSHAMKVFSARFFLGNNWEEQKIREFMGKNDKS